MKPTLNQEIESSKKGIDYVNSLVPTNNDVIGSVIEKIKDSEYSPNYVKYHDGEKWVEVYSDSETVFTKQQMIDLGISNNIPEEIEKFRKVQEMRKTQLDIYIKYSGKIILFCMSLCLFGIIYKLILKQ